MPEAYGLIAITVRQDEQAQQRPGCRQTQIESPPLFQRFLERARKEGPVVQPHHDWGGDHHLFAAHAQQAGGDGTALPEIPSHRNARTNDAIHGEQVEETREQLRALGNVRHRPSEQRVHGPKQRYRQSHKP